MTSTLLVQLSLLGSELSFGRNGNDWAPAGQPIDAVRIRRGNQAAWGKGADVIGKGSVVERFRTVAEPVRCRSFELGEFDSEQRRR